MQLTDKLYESSKDIWDTYYHHPFVAGIGDGSLEIEKFKFFMIQDYLYLYEYAKVFALGVAKSKDPESVVFFSRMISNILDGEMAIHKAYMQRLGVTEEDVNAAIPSLTNSSYTNYMITIGYEGGILDILTAILACSWSYARIGRKLAQIPGSLVHPFYGEWIKGYSCEDYTVSNDSLIRRINSLGQNISESETKHLMTIFRNCSRYEAMFWDMSYRMVL